MFAFLTILYNISAAAENDNEWTNIGYTNATPRDTLMVVGDEIIESASAWRSRLFEGYAYKKLFCEYFRQGAKWTAAPRPSMADDLYSKVMQIHIQIFVVILAA